MSFSNTNKLQGSFANTDKLRVSFQITDRLRVSFANTDKLLVSFPNTDKLLVSFPDTHGQPDNSQNSKKMPPYHMRLLQTYHDAPGVCSNHTNPTCKQCRANFRNPVLQRLAIPKFLGLPFHTRDLLIFRRTPGPS